ncbi:MAG: DUF5694 domain-containing protein [Candidatus Marinimicrobia bacterium]|nr:DUF5694 domain-containing protein [Candidatus Neomarinimicrobiota bacterium]
MSFTFVLGQEKEEIKKPSSFFPQEKTKVLVVGTFHFDYPGRDVHKTKDENKIDVLKEPKKSEVTELVNYIKKFKPTKIAIEADDDWQADQKLKEYNLGKYRNERDERFQLGMRIASELQIKTIYAINAWSMVELEELDSNYIEQLSHYFESDDPYSRMMLKWYEYSDKLIHETTLLNYFKYINSKESHKYDYGAYLVAGFKLDNISGPDVLSIWWYNRNLRIFKNIQKITESKDDRILVIIGNGHAAVLRQLLECLQNTNLSNLIL